MKRKLYTSAPLPFQGQKRNFVKRFYQAIEEMNKKHTIHIVVDLFGGSGLLSHAAKLALPEAQVIYNDFDDYHKRLENISNTNNLIWDIRDLVTSEKGKKTGKEEKMRVLKRIKEEEEQNGYVDYITISSSLLFSTNYVINFEELEKATFYNNIKLSDYDLSRDYLKDIDIVKQDYKVLFEWYKNTRDVLFIVDPPYLSTDTKTYNSEKYWKLTDYLDVIKVLNNTNYFYFTSDKSSLVELYKWFYENHGINNPLDGAHCCTQYVRMNYSCQYTDMMFYKWKQ